MYLVGEATGRKMQEACSRHISLPMAVQSEKNALTRRPTKAVALRLFHAYRASYCAFGGAVL